jgi:hypothetical protein
MGDVRMAGRLLAAAYFAAFAVAVAGCCVSARGAEDLDRRLELRNQARADAVMRAVAERRGAVLLHDSGHSWPMCQYFPCGSEAALPPPYCMERSAAANCFLPWGSSEVGAYPVLTDEGTMARFIYVSEKDGAYARLARRGNTLLVLVPKVSRRTVGERALCCEGHPAWMSEVVRSAFGFLLHDIDPVEVESVDVPLPIDVLNWKDECVAKYRLPR